MWLNQKPNVALQCVSTNDQMILSNLVPAIEKLKKRSFFFTWKMIIFYIFSNNAGFYQNCTFLKWGAPSQWSFGPDSTWGSKETMTIGKMHPTLLNSIEYF